MIKNEQKQALTGYLVEQTQRGMDIRNPQISTKELSEELGFSDHYIYGVLPGEIIERIERGKYNINIKELVPALYQQYLNLIETDPQTADSISHACCEKRPLFMYYKYFYECVIRGEYLRSIEFYEDLLKTENNFCYADLVYYLYLLNHIVELPPRYKEYLNGFQTNSNLLRAIKIAKGDPRYDKETRKARNLIRKCIIQGKYEQIKPLVKILNLKSSKQSNDIIEVELLNALTKATADRMAKVNFFANQGDYARVEEALTKNSQIELAAPERGMLSLARQAAQMQAQLSEGKAANTTDVPLQYTKKKNN